MTNELKTLNAKQLKAIELNKVLKWFYYDQKNNNCTKEDGIENIPKELQPLYFSIHEVLVSAGKACDILGYEDFYSILKKNAEGTNEKGQYIIEGNKIIKMLVNTIPAFDDRGTIGNKEVYLMKKVQLSLSEVCRIHTEFVFKDMARIGAIIDNVVPGVMLKAGVIQFKNKEDEANRIHFSWGGIETEYRLLGVYVINKLTELAKGAYNGAQCSYYLWRLGKHPEFRSFDRHYTKDTV
eukprot:CAMPEP_0117425554 /NCGR_PEP_ID=MMETSP0758-20121206/5813_1 /TAXON_ID=63605 /ORGANISM="Percolomonas cosmopolitus, Strain AE-1 (ATCC 50343)" /LENGTH=237 /DNA_ID=CAMNT_0005210129 /DNA_START=323 /DNA_END=1033 /DNA_ORIENTATION=+